MNEANGNAGDHARSCKVSSLFYGEFAADTPPETRNRALDYRISSGIPTLGQFRIALEENRKQSIMPCN
jgi:hypothetical protein